MIDYNEWRRDNGLRPATGTKLPHTIAMTARMWTQLLQVALETGCMYRGKPSVSIMLEKIAEGTFTIQRQGE